MTKLGNQENVQVEGRVHPRCPRTVITHASVPSTSGAKGGTGQNMDSPRAGSSRLPERLWLAFVVVASHTAQHLRRCRLAVARLWNGFLPPIGELVVDDLSRQVTHPERSRAYTFAGQPQMRHQPARSRLYDGRLQKRTSYAKLRQLLSLARVLPTHSTGTPHAHNQVTIKHTPGTKCFRIPILSVHRTCS